jgi:hypothetical protein
MVDDKNVLPRTVEVGISCPLQQGLCTIQATAVRPHTFTDYLEIVVFFEQGTQTFTHNLVVICKYDFQVHLY